MRHSCVCFLFFARAALGVLCKWGFLHWKLENASHAERLSRAFMSLSVMYVCIFIYTEIEYIDDPEFCTSAYPALEAWWLKLGGLLGSRTQQPCGVPKDP